MSTELPDPKSFPELFEGLLVRRTIAYFIDVAIMAAILGGVSIAGVIFGLLTTGVALIAVPFALPASIVFYYASTLGSPRRATIGMRMMDIVLTPTRTRTLDGWRAFFHPLLFWLTCWFLPPFSYLLALFTPRRQLIHDLVLGTLMVRRSPMEHHWARYGAPEDAYPE